QRAQTTRRRLRHDRAMRGGRARRGDDGGGVIMEKRSITFEKRNDGVGVVIIDVPGESQNTLKESFQDDFNAVRKEIDSAGVKAIVLTSGKDNSFLAGADINMIKTLTSAEDAEKRSRGAQKNLDEVENSPIPFVAAIHGACLG